MHLLQNTTYVQYISIRLGNRPSQALVSISSSSISSSSSSSVFSKRISLVHSIQASAIIDRRQDHDLIRAIKSLRVPWQAFPVIGFRTTPAHCKPQLRILLILSLLTNTALMNRTRKRLPQRNFFLQFFGRNSIVLINQLCNTTRMVKLTTGCRNTGEDLKAIDKNALMLSLRRKQLILLL